MRSRAAPPLPARKPMKAGLRRPARAPASAGLCAAVVNCGSDLSVGEVVKANKSVFFYNMLRVLLWDEILYLWIWFFGVFFSPG